jgi:hypothetical protein
VDVRLLRYILVEVALICIAVLAVGVAARWSCGRSVGRWMRAPANSWR